MIIGVPKEIKEKEFRVGIVPSGVKSLVLAGHTVLVEQGAGEGSGIDDGGYRAVGAIIAATAAEVWTQADLVMKVKEPLAPEYPLLKPGLILYTYLHLAPLPELTQALLDARVTGVAYETVQLDNGFLPLLAPMSQVAGRMAIQVGAHFLEKEAGGRGVLLAGVPGVPPGHVTILGSGTVAVNAAQMAMGLGAEVAMLGRNLPKLAELDTLFRGRVRTLAINQHTIEEELAKADLVVGAVLVVGGRAPRLISREMLSLMPKGAVIVDVAIDQGGCAETSRPTFHSAPVYEVDGIIHYCVANMPGAVPRTSTFALTNATLPYALAMADKGFAQAAKDDPPLFRGITTYQGALTNRLVAESQGRDWQPLQL
ncbi:MAG: alanine dehydrogenase [Deltaproteobacteria bacterium]|uniref:alanine dehydrogenase n=1 Tax=Hydrosulfovibrio ferrireducens TaxID=2934181 RepID=UPI0011FD68BB|nr:MAG: alanine dehydrogenase [Deltaproteobacteria bacterium]